MHSTGNEARWMIFLGLQSQRWMSWGCAYMFNAFDVTHVIVQYNMYKINEH